MNPNQGNLPWLVRPLRAFEAMLDQMKTEGKYKMVDPELTQLVRIEMEHFGIIKDGKQLKEHENKMGGEAAFSQLNGLKQ